MKKLVLSAAVALLAFTASAQDMSFGVTAGYQSLAVKSELTESATFQGQSVSQTTSVSTSDGGFVIGGFAQFELTDKIALRPELVYSSIKNFSSLQIPVMGMYMVTEEISIQAGPQIMYSLEDLGPDISKLAFQFGIGGGYQINENFDVNLRYAFGLTGFDGESETTEQGIKIKEEFSSKPSTLTLTVGYKFN